MKLHVVVGSGNCRKVQAIVSSLGVDVDIEYLDFFAGDLTTPEYLALNPNGRVPTLADGDFTLWESNAIMQYLADKVSGNPLFPQDPRTRGPAPISSAGSAGSWRTSTTLSRQSPLRPCLKPSY